MSTASALRLQVESSLAHRIPNALTPAPRAVLKTATTAIHAIDEALRGGLPVGRISEFVGPECSGRTSLALSTVAAATQTDQAVAWIDVSSAFDPVSAVAAGVNLPHLLWVRCGVVSNVKPSAVRPFSIPAHYLLPNTVKQRLHGGSFGPHPRTEEKGLSEGVTGLLHPEPRCTEPQRRARVKHKRFEQGRVTVHSPAPPPFVGDPWTQLDQALRSTDQLLQGGGFGVIVLDMGSLPPEVVSRVPLATWFRYRAAAERTQSVVLLLTQQSCAKSAAGLLMRFQSAGPGNEMATVLTDTVHDAEVVRQRFTEMPSRKPPQSASFAQWRSRAAWVGPR